MRSIALKYTLVLLIYAVLLSSCSLLTQSPFSPWIGLVERQTTVGDEVPYDPIGDYNVHVVDDGTSEYVFVVADIPGKDKYVAIYDTDLKLREAIQEPFVSQRFDGSSVPVADAVGNVYLGLLAFGPGLEPKADLTNSKTGSEVHVTDGADFLSYELNGAQLGVRVNRVHPGGSGPSFAVPFDGTSGTNYRSAYAATSHIADTLLFVAFEETNSSLGGFVSTPSTVVTANLGGPAVITTPGGFSFPIDFDPEEPAATKDAIIARGYGPEGEVLRAYDTSGNELGSIGIDIDQHVIATSLVHNHVYIYDPETEIVRRIGKWW